MTKNLSIKFDKSPNTLKSLEHFNLADIDASYLNIYVKMLMRNSRLNCISFVNSLSIIKSMNNGFYKLYNLDNNNLTIFNYNHNLFVAKCLNINNIQILNEKICYNNLKIRFILNNEWKIGFLLNNKIIVNNSQQINCNNSFKYYYFDQSKTSVIRENNIFKIINESRPIIKFKPENVNFNSIDFHHDSNELEGFSLHDDFKLQFNSQINQDNFEFEEQITSEWTNDSFKTKTLLISIFSIFFLLIISTLLYVYFKGKKLINYFKKKQNTQVELIEMDMIKEKTVELTKSNDNITPSLISTNLKSDSKQTPNINSKKKKVNNITLNSSCPEELL